MPNPLHLWYGFLSDTFYVGRTKDVTDKPGQMVATGNKTAIPEGDVVGAFKAWLLQRQNEEVVFEDGSIRWIPMKSEEGEHVDA